MARFSAFEELFSSRVGERRGEMCCRLLITTKNQGSSSSGRYWMVCGQELQYDLYRGRLLGILVELWLCLIRVAPKLINPKWSSH